MLKRISYAVLGAAALNILLWVGIIETVLYVKRHW